MLFARTRTIKQKIILGTAVNCAIALLLAFASLVIYNYLNFRTQIANDYNTLAKILESTNREAVATKSTITIDEQTKRILQHKPEVIAACVYLPDGTIFSRYTRANSESVIFPHLQNKAVTSFNKGWIDIFHPIQNTGVRETIGVQYIRVDNTVFQKEVANYIALFMIIIPFPVSMAIILALFLQRSMAKPLTELGQAAKQISKKKNFDTRIKLSTNDEIGVLASEFNEMLLEIEKYDSDRKNIVRILEEKIQARVIDLKKEITQRKKAEKREHDLQKRLDRSRRMESLGILAGGVAHDLNNILGPVVGYPDLILSELPDDSPIRPDLEAIHSSALRAAAVIQDLLALARRGNYQLTVISIKDLVYSYLTSPEFIEKQMVHNSIDLITDIAPNTPGAKASEVHLRQVLMNLTINAMEAMPDGGTLTIKSKACWIKKPTVVYSGTMPKGRYTQLQIIDTGEGIKPQDAECIFEPFYTKKQMGKSGTGLGLAIVYGIVSDLKGFIDLKSIFGEGTEFSLYFPATNYVNSTQTNLTKPVRKGDERILIVDDNQQQRALAKKLLSHLGYEVFCIESGRKAVQVVRNNDFDLILMDMVLEDGLDGLDTIESILNYKPAQRFVIASGFAESHRAKKAQQITNAPYLTKPYSLDDLGQATRNVLDRKPKSRLKNNSASGPVIL
ncbi:MAG: response regulator [Calditrichaeota bacterium]|nr:MAG: response regulator [Calditrichota bacterium]